MGWQDAPIVEQAPKWAAAPAVDASAAQPAAQPQGKGFWTRTLRGARDPIDAGAQMLVRGVEAAIPDSWTSLDQWAKGEVAKVDQINQAAEQDYQQNWRGGETGFDGARLLGNIVATAPLAAILPSGAGLGLAARTGLSAAGGGAFGTLQPVDTSAGGDFWTEKAKQAGTGAAFGAVAAPITAGFARLVSPKSSPQVQTMLREGVTPTPGQVLGGAFKTTEDKLTSVPILGDVIKAGQRRALRQFNEAALRRALDPIDQSVPRGSIGRDAIGQAQAALSGSYDDVLNRAGAPAVDDQMLSELANLRSLLANVNPAKKLDEQLDNIINNEILSRTQYGRIPGESIKAAERNLGEIARGSMRGDFDTQKLGEAVREAQNIVRQWLERSAPADVAKDLRATNQGYANFMRVQRAASALGGEEGVFTPAQLLNAVKALDPTRNKGGFARGGAMLQDLAEPAKTVLSQSVPDSGTAGRLLATILMGGAPVASLVHPAAGAAILPAAAYAPGVQRAVASLLAGRQQPMLKATAQGMRTLTPTLGALLAGQVAGAQ